MTGNENGLHVTDIFKQPFDEGLGLRHELNCQSVHISLEQPS